MAVQVTARFLHSFDRRKKTSKSKADMLQKIISKCSLTNYLYGDSTSVLNDKSSIAISDRLAQMLFNTTENCIGKTVEFEHQTQFQVSGVYRSVSINASEQFEFVLPYEVYRSQIMGLNHGAIPD